MVPSSSLLRRMSRKGSCPSDSFSIVNYMVDSFHGHLNSIDPCIQFTMKKELDRQLPFLDILLSRKEDGAISTSYFT